MSSESPLVSTKEVDYLDEDKPLRGQNYVCLSFISPEDILADKEVYAFGKYLSQFSKDFSTMLDMLIQKYPDDKDLLTSLRENNGHIYKNDELQEQYRFFRRTNSAEIDREFLEKNDFKTSVRGIKVRGSFETLKEAQIRAEVLKKMGDKFDIFIGQVGCWCPWSPNPEDLENQEYAETQLNTIMKKYRENMQLKDEFFEQRKQEKIEQSIAEKDAWTKRKEEESASTSAVVEMEESQPESEPKDSA
jgi:hypothetical protein